MLFNKVITNISLISNSSLFHTTSHNAAIGKAMKKLMSGTKKKRHIYSEQSIVPNSNTFADIFKKCYPQTSRRQQVLNKLFMMRITDLMSTGENALEFAGYGIEINRVKVTPDYQGLNVYWVAKQSLNDTEIEELLHSKSSSLRHELTQLHVMGMVPRIKFIKDKEYARLMEVDSRLAYADYGEDFEPSDASIRFKSYLELKTTLDPKLQEKISTLEDKSIREDEKEIPPMPQNVLGLDHTDIMDRIKKSMKKSLASHRHQDVDENVIHPFNPDPIEFKSVKAQREAFQKFLSERQILRYKAQKLNKNVKPEWDYLMEEAKIQKENQLNSYKFEYLDDTDYIEDDNEDDNENK